MRMQQAHAASHLPLGRTMHYSSSMFQGMPSLYTA